MPGPAKRRILMLAVALAGAGLVRPPVCAQTAPLDGRALAFDRDKGNCLTCHAIAGGDSPGTVGPPLADMKRRFPDRAALVAIVADETQRNPLTVMPPFRRNLILTDREIEAVVDFLYTL